MHAHEVEFQIKNLADSENVESCERILSEFTTYSGKFTFDQLSRFCSAIISKNIAFESDIAKDALKVIFEKNKENLEKSEYVEILTRLD